MSSRTLRLFTIAGALMTLVSCNHYFALYGLVPEYSTYEFSSIPEEFESPSHLIRWTANFITYVPDRGENWQLPHETYERRTGDCEDTSIFILHLLRIYFPEAEVYMESGHSIYGYGHAWVSVNNVQYETADGNSYSWLPSQYNRHRNTYTYAQVVSMAALK